MQWCHVWQRTMFLFEQRCFLPLYPQLYVIFHVPLVWYNKLIICNLQKFSVFLAKKDAHLRNRYLFHRAGEYNFYSALFILGEIAKWQLLALTITV